MNSIPTSSVSVKRRPGASVLKRRAARSVPVGNAIVAAPAARTAELIHSHATRGSTSHRNAAVRSRIAVAAIGSDQGWQRHEFRIW